ncbi:MAG: PAS domain-containing sensor histidine kinase [Armatimonadota bacterium]
MPKGITVESNMGSLSRVNLPDDTPKAKGDYTPQFARLVVLVAAFAVGWLLNHFSSGKPYFALLALAGVVLVCVGLVLGPRSQRASARAAVPLFDLAWIMFAMYLTEGLSSALLPLLYIIVAVVAMRGNNWEIGTTVAGAITGIFILASTRVTGSSFALAVAQSTLLAAAALAVRLIAASGGSELEVRKSQVFYRSLLQNTSDAVFTLNPVDWVILEANPAAGDIVASESVDDIIGQPLDKVIHFQDHAFPGVCRAALSRAREVHNAVTYVQAHDGRRLMMRVNLMASADQDADTIQAVMEIAGDEEVATQVQPLRRDDFSVNYIPSLTHELNNHLAAIRLSAELAATTGATPDFGEMQRQVDHCQEVLQTVVLQILRAATPVSTTGKTPVSDLHTVVERCLLLTRPQVLTGGVQLQVDVPAALPSVLGFDHELQEALIRILIRSVKSMSHQDPPRLLTLRVTPKSHEVEISLTDSAEGLTSRELTVANGRFAAVSRAEDRTWEIVREASCRFGGSVSASNGLNGGMRVRISLPIMVEEVGVAV